MNTRITKIAIGMAGSIAALCSGTANAGDLILNTGFDHSTGSVYAIGDKDDYWIKIASYERPANPVAVDAANVVALPMPPFVTIDSDTRWLSHNSAAGSSGTNDLFKGYSIYRKCFCIIDEVREREISFDVMADDKVQVWMNSITNTLISPTVGNFWAPNTPHPYRSSGEGVLQPGRNCLYVLVEDRGGVAAFNLKGKVTGALTKPAFGPEMEYGECCDEVNDSGTGGAGQPIAPNLDPKELEAMLGSIEVAKRLRAVEAGKMRVEPR